MSSVTIRSPGDYQRAVNRLKTADRYERAALLEAMLHYDCVTNDNHPCKFAVSDAPEVSACSDRASLETFDRGVSHHSRASR